MIKSLFVSAALVSTLALSACMDTTNATNTANATVVDSVIGKRLVSENSTFLIRADGTMGGTLRGEEIIGTYTANSREICSTYSAPAALTGREYCSTPAINGNMLIFNRRDGSQSATYTIEG